MITLGHFLLATNCEFPVTTSKVALVVFCSFSHVQPRSACFTSLPSGSDILVSNVLIGLGRIFHTL